MALAAHPSLTAAVPQARRKSLLLVEPQSIVRHTVATVARELDLADIREASNFEAALQLLNDRPFDGMLLDVDSGLGGLSIVQSVRSGDTPSHPAVPIVLMTASCDPGTVNFYKPLSIQRIMLKPFKVKTVLETVALLVRPNPPATPAM